MIKELKNSEEIKSFISKKGYSVIDVYSDNCPACVKMDKEYKTLATKVDSSRLAKINASDNTDFLSEIGVRSLPAFVVFLDGQMQHLKTGFINVSKMEEILTSCV